MRVLVWVVQSSTEFAKSFGDLGTSLGSVFLSMLLYTLYFAMTYDLSMCIPRLVQGQCKYPESTIVLCKFAISPP